MDALILDFHTFSFSAIYVIILDITHFIIHSNRDLLFTEKKLNTFLLLLLLEVAPLLHILRGRKRQKNSLKPSKNLDMKIKSLKTMPGPI